MARLLLPTLTSAAEIDNLDPGAVVEAMRHDKKRSGPGLAVVIPEDDWSLVLASDVAGAEAVRALDGPPGALDAGAEPSTVSSASLDTIAVVRLAFRRLRADRVRLPFECASQGFRAAKPAAATLHLSVGPERYGAQGHRISSRAHVSVHRKGRHAEG